jgi:hypothetical protein
VPLAQKTSVKTLVVKPACVDNTRLRPFPSASSGDAWLGWLVLSFLQQAILPCGRAAFSMLRVRKMAGVAL